jgi:hypothetical protein
MAVDEEAHPCFARMGHSARHWSSGCNESQKRRQDAGATKETARKTAPIAAEFVRHLACLC